MKNNSNKLNQPERDIKKEKVDNPPGYPLYPDSDDIYEKSHEEKDLNPEDTSKKKTSKSNNIFRRKELDKKNVLSGEDLDVPGSELDDDQEAIGSEDEENNYYSLGGDDHDDLEEDQAGLD